MNLQKVFWGSLLVSCGWACTTTRHTAAVPGLYPDGPLWAALWQQRSGEYKALCFQAYRLAASRLDALLVQGQGGHPAIVTDIDETILDNSPATVHDAIRGRMYTDSAWLRWSALARADTVPGALSFFRYAHSRGVAVYYVSNRTEAERSVTLDNLHKWGFPDADNAHLLLKDASSDKTGRRSKVAEDHTILLLVGDNLSDFSAVFHRDYDERNSLVIREAARFGKDYVILPNPMYGDWEGALFGYRYGLSVAHKDSLMRAALRDYSGDGGSH